MTAAGVIKSLPGGCVVRWVGDEYVSLAVPSLRDADEIIRVITRQIIFVEARRDLDSTTVLVARERNLPQLKVSGLASRKKHLGSGAAWR